MLDQEMKEQLRGVFAKLESKVALVYDDSTNENQPELRGEIIRPELFEEGKP